MFGRLGVRIAVLLLVAMSLLAVLPVAAQSSCTISTRSGNVRMRAGHSTNDAVVGNMPRNVQLQAVERYVEPLGGKKTRVWYRLLKEEAAPTSTYEQVWVGGTVKTKGDCVNIASSAPAAAPSGDPAAAPAAPAASTSGVVLPQNGVWGLTVGDNLTGSCPGLGEVSIPYSAVFGGMSNQGEAVIASSANGFTLDGVEFTRDGNGSWNGYYGDYNGQAVFRVDTPTSILGDLIVTSSDGCSLKTPLWGSPK
jgi:hypothetical protein